MSNSLDKAHPIRIDERKNADDTVAQGHKLNDDIMRALSVRVHTSIPNSKGGLSLLFVHYELADAERFSVGICRCFGRWGDYGGERDDGDV